MKRLVGVGFIVLVFALVSSEVIGAVNSGGVARQHGASFHTGGTSVVPSFAAEQLTGGVIYPGSGSGGYGDCGLLQPFCQSRTAPTCPHMCIPLRPGETAEEAIALFERRNQCTVRGGDTTECGKKDRIQYLVLEKNENDSLPPALKAYVPRNKKTGKAIGKSGVTVSYGVDLGQQSMEDLKSWGISKGLRKKLKDYLGKKKSDAILYLYGDGTKKHPAHPLTITKAEATELDEGARSYIVGKLAASFNKDNAQGVDFYQLPVGTQTALADFFYQHGAYSDKAYPNLWKSIKKLDWGEVARKLALEPGKPRRRLKNDARLVKTDVSSDKFDKHGVPKC